MLLFLCLLRRLLLAGFDIGLVLRGARLLLGEPLSALGPLLRILGSLTARVVELALEIGLLSVVSRLIRRALWCFGAAPRFVERMLALLLFERFGVTCIGSRPLGGLRRLARRLDGLPLVALLGAGGPLLIIERQLLGTNLRLRLTHLILRSANARVDEKLRVAVVRRHAVFVVILGRALVQRFLTHVEIIRDLIGTHALRHLPRLRGTGRCCGQTLRRGRQRARKKRRRSESGRAPNHRKTGDRQRHERGSEHARNSNTGG